MVKIQINGIEQELSSVSRSWIHEQINNRQKNRAPVCVRVFIKIDEVDIVLSSGDCPQFGSSGRKTTPKEDYLFELWESRHLKSSPINSGHLVAFLQQLESYSR